MLIGHPKCYRNCHELVTSLEGLKVFGGFFFPFSDEGLVASFNIGKVVSA